MEGHASSKLKMLRSELRNLSRWEKHLIGVWVNRGAKNG